MTPPLRSGARPRGAARRARRRHDRLRRDRPRAARADEKDVEFTAAPFGVVGSRPRSRSRSSWCARSGMTPLELIDALLDAAGAHPRPPRRHARARRPGRPRAGRPRARLEGRRGRAHLALEELRVPGARAARPRAAHLGRRAARARRWTAEGARVSERAVLALADGTVFEGEAFGAARDGDRRGRLQHRHDRLPGDPHRSVLRRADRVHDLPRDRQHRRQPRGRGVARHLPSGFVVRDHVDFPSNWRSRESLDAYLTRHDIPASAGSTRARWCASSARRASMNGDHRARRDSTSRRCARARRRCRRWRG